jgi:hypothetical protein
VAGTVLRFRLQGAGMSTLVLTLLLATLAAGADTSQLPKEAAGALDPAVKEAISHFNKVQDQLRTDPRVESAGSPKDPSMLRATYRRANSGYQVTGIEAGAAPVAAVRVRAIELEKRVTNVNAGDIRAEFSRAPWRETPRGWVLDFRFRWTGKTWEPMGDPTEFPTLGVAGE